MTWQRTINCRWLPLIAIETYTLISEQLIYRKSGRTLITQAPVISSWCNKSDLIVTDPYSGEVICSNCSMVIWENSKQIDQKDVLLTQKKWMPKVEQVFQLISQYLQVKCKFITNIDWISSNKEMIIILWRRQTFS
jgi:hypothetical protein